MPSGRVIVIMVGGGAGGVGGGAGAPVFVVVVVVISKNNWGVGYLPCTCPLSPLALVVTALSW